MNTAPANDIQNAAGPSSTVETFIRAHEFARTRTLALLNDIAARPDAQQVLAWRPGPGRAHIGWQLAHIAVTEDIFATERLAPHKPGRHVDLWPRFRGGSTPDDNVPTAAQLPTLLQETRADLRATLGEYGEDRLEEIPAALAARKLTVRDVLALIGWHEAHHQGQAHLTFNLYKVQTA